MALDSRTFRKALGCFPTGVTVVTTLAADGSPVGVTIGSFTSLSLDPPLVLFCLDNKSDQIESFRRSGNFVVNVLSQGQRELSILFSTKMQNKFAGVNFDCGVGGLPVLPGCLANIECSMVQIHDGGDHQIFIGRVEHLCCSETGDPLVFFRGSYAGLGGIPVP
jgi:flavin reductase (DIM6/NTAB) family NADH-FMN oxidoreductase RutF